MRQIALLLAACTALLIGACDVPRNNPYDPQADNYLGSEANLGSLSGRVTRLYSPAVGLSGAQIASLPDNSGFIIAAASGPNGNYTIENVPPGQYQLICSLSGHLADTISVTIYPGTQSTVNFHLDALPVIQNFTITSQYIAWGVPPLYLERALLATITATDEDGFTDIDSLHLNLEGVLDTTFFNPDSTGGITCRQFIRLSQTVFPGGTISPDLVGDNFHCTVKDKSSGLGQASSTVAHIFPTLPVPDVVPPNIWDWMQPFILEWAPYTASFPFTYSAWISPSATPTQITWHQDDIPSTITHTDSIMIDPGNYIWTLEIIDDYGDFARALPSDPFTVWPIP